MFTLPLSPEEEYWVGYLRADGHLGSNETGARWLRFSQKHKEPVEALASFLKTTNRVRCRNITTNYGNSDLYEFGAAAPAYPLYELGLKGNLHPSLYNSKHFWRGLLDGDGSAQFVRSGSRFTPAIFWCGYEIDMVQLSNWIASTLNCKAPKVGFCRNIYRIGLNGRKAQALGLLLYTDEYSALAYKKTAALSFKDWVPAR